MGARGLDDFFRSTSGPSTRKNQRGQRIASRHNPVKRIPSHVGTRVEVPDHPEQPVAADLRTV
jgi:hypothetical protein